jgi:hypothetical protein
MASSVAEMQSPPMYNNTNPGQSGIPNRFILASGGNVHDTKGIPRTNAVKI